MVVRVKPPSTSTMSSAMTLFCNVPNGEVPTDEKGTMMDTALPDVFL